MATFKLPIKKLPITIKYLESYDWDIIDTFLRTEMSFEEAVAAVNKAAKKTKFTKKKYNGLLRYNKEYNTFICYNLDKDNKKQTKNWQMGKLEPGEEKEIDIKKMYNVENFFEKYIIDNNDYVYVARSDSKETITISADTKGWTNSRWPRWKLPTWWGQNPNKQRELVLRF